MYRSGRKAGGLPPRGPRRARLAFWSSRSGMSCGMPRRRSAARLARDRVDHVPGRRLQTLAGPTRGAGHRDTVQQPHPLAVSASCPGVGWLVRFRPRPSAIVWIFVVQPPRDRPSPSRRAAVTGLEPLTCGRRRRTGGPAPRWSRRGHSSPGHRRRRRRPVTPLRSGPRYRPAPTARTSCTTSGGTRTGVVRLRPGATGTDPEQGAVDDLPVVTSPATSSRGHVRQQRRDPRVLGVGELEPSDHDELSTSPVI